MASLWRFYLRMLRNYTLPTQMCTGATIGLTGDSIAQNLVESKEQQDWKRTGRQIFYSFAIFSPAANRMFALLQRVQLKTAWRTAFARTGIDMVTFMPFTSVMFFASMGLMEGRPIAEIKQRWQTNFPNIIRIQYMVFGPAQLINMGFLPLYARPPFINCIGLGWTVYLAWVNSPAGQSYIGITQEETPITASRIEL